MSVAEVLVAACFFVLAVAHSALGEAKILRPLFAVRWTMATTQRSSIERVLRFVWHATSMAWITIALAVLEVPLLPTVAALSLSTAALIFVMLRSHLAWPLFLLAGLAALHAEDLLSDRVFQVAAALTTIVLVATAAVHVYWAAGGSWMADRALPTTGQRSFSPPRLLTLAVALALVVFAGLVSTVAFVDGPEQARWLVIAGVAVLGVRAFGDTRVAGFTKTVRGTAFAIADDRWFTPLVVFLALGATGALLV